eukprot:2861205-Pyramimonas_sp.AAC.2
MHTVDVFARGGSDGHRSTSTDSPTRHISPVGKGIFHTHSGGKTYNNRRWGLFPGFFPGLLGVVLKSAATTAAAG